MFFAQTVSAACANRRSFSVRVRRPRSRSDELAPTQLRPSVTQRKPMRAGLPQPALAILGITLFLSPSLACTQTDSDPSPARDAVAKSATHAGLNTKRAVTEGSTVPYRHPTIDPAKELTGAALLAALKKGGFVLYMRHTQTGTVTPECTQSNLSPAGERDARYVGSAMRQLRIPVARIYSSPVCRVSDTARLLGLGEFETTVDLSDVPASKDVDLVAARRARIAAAPARKDANTMLVGHMHAGGADENAWMRLDFGEIIVYRTQPSGAVPVARIRAEDWSDLRNTEKTAASGARDTENDVLRRP